MYRIKRTTEAVIVSKNNSPKFNAPLDSLLVYRDGDGQRVSKVGDLTDEQLLMALINCIEIKEGLSI